MSVETTCKLTGTASGVPGLWKQEASLAPKGVTSLSAPVRLAAVSPLLDAMAIATRGTVVIFSRLFPYHRYLTSIGQSMVDFSETARFDAPPTEEIATEPGREASPEVVTAIMAAACGSRKEAFSIFIVGYSSGCVRVLMPDGRPCVAQRFSTGPVIRIRSQSAAVPDIVVLYSASIVVIDGASLTGLLRAASAGSDAPSLSCKQWAIDCQARCCDIAPCGVAVCGVAHSAGLEVPSAYAQIMSADASGEAFHRFISVGENPMVGIYTTVGCDRPFFSVTALASNMATRLGSAVVSVVSSLWGKKPASKPEARESIARSIQQQLTSLPLSFCLNDSRRCVTSITLNPLLDLCAMADNFGRVMLLETATGTIVRMWKGYRDAQVGWITSSGRLAKSPTSVSCESCFLVILAPRRSLLEIWAMRGGGRVVAFNVPEGSSLIYTPSVVLGSVPSGLATYRCVLLGDDGSLNELSVPFSAAESDVLSTRSRDRGLLQRLDELLASWESPVDEVLGTLRELSRALSLKQALEALCQPHTASAVLGPAVLLVAERLTGPLAGDEIAEAATLSKLVLQNIDLHARFAVLLPATGQLCARVEDISLVSLPHLSAERQAELGVLLSRFVQNDLASKAEDFVCSVGLFAWVIVQGPDGVALRSPIADDDLVIIAHHFFGSLAGHYQDPQQLENLLLSTRLSSADLTRLFLVWQLNQAPATALHPILLEYLPRLLSFLADMDRSRSGVLWDLLYREVVSSTNVATALALVLVASHPSLCDRDWSVLIGRLESLTSLVLVSQHNPVKQGFSVHRMLTSLSYEDTVAEVLLLLNLSPEELLQAGSAASPAGKARSMLVTHAPISCSADALAVRCAWLLAMKWDASVATLSLLELAVKFISILSVGRARHGLALTIWMQFLRLRVGEAVALVEKVGKCPKERLCLKHLNMPAGEAAAMCRASRHLFELLTAIVVDAPQLALMDDFWSSPVGRNAESVADTRTQELQSALGAGLGSSSLAMEHGYLCAVVELVYDLDLKSVHPLALFQSSVRSRFFSPLVSLGDDPGKEDDAQEVLSTCRWNFISSALASAVQIKPSLVELVFSLSESFGLNMDDLRAQHICNLHERGLPTDDGLCHMQVPAVLGPLLLDIDRRRLWAYVQTQPMKDRMDLVAHMPVELHEWLASCPAKTSAQCDVALLEASQAVTALRRAIAVMRPGSPESSRAGQLLVVLDSIARVRS